MKTQLNWSQYTMRCFMPISITTRKHYYWIISNLRRSSVRKGVLRNLAKFTGKHLCQSLFFNIFCFLIAASGLQFYFKALTHVFSCEFYKISKNTFFREHLWGTVITASSDPLDISFQQEPLFHYYEGENNVSWRVTSIHISSMLKQIVAHNSSRFYSSTILMGHLHSYPCRGESERFQF